MKLPKARTADILEQEVGAEPMIYDLRIDKAYTLNETSKIIYRACSRLSFDELKSRYKFTDNLIYLALDELHKNDLLEVYESEHFAGLTRREAIKRVGLSTLTALPLIAGISAPKAANAASSRVTCAASGQRCTFDNAKQGNCCRSDQRCVIGSTCADCLRPGESYLSGFGVIREACDITPAKNACCIATGNAGWDGSNCKCPGLF